MKWFKILTLILCLISFKGFGQVEFSMIYDGSAVVFVPVQKKVIADPIDSVIVNDVSIPVESINQNLVINFGNYGYNVGDTMDVKIYSKNGATFYLTSEIYFASTTLYGAPLSRNFLEFKVTWKGDLIVKLKEDHELIVNVHGINKGFDNNGVWVGYQDSILFSFSYGSPGQLVKFNEVIRSLQFENYYLTLEAGDTIYKASVLHKPIFEPQYFEVTNFKPPENLIFEMNEDTFCRVKLCQVNQQGNLNRFDNYRDLIVLDSIEYKEPGMRKIFSFEPNLASGYTYVYFKVEISPDIFWYSGIFEIFMPSLVHQIDEQNRVVYFSRETQYTVLDMNRAEIMNGKGDRVDFSELCSKKYYLLFDNKEVLIKLKKCK